MNLKFSCILESTPLLIVQSYIWINNLLSLDISPSDIYIHIVGKISKEYDTYLINKGVNVVYCSSFDNRNKYCNKLQQLSTFVDSAEFDYVFLMDCDTAIVSLDDLELNENVYAKIVDFPLPPINILEQVFAKEGFELEQATTSFSLNNKNITDWNNCNGGVYIIHRDFVPSLAPKWKKYSLNCIENKEIFSVEYEKHADQVGFALAMTALNERTEHLDIKWNFPIHVENNHKIAPKIVHFHDCLDSNLNLKLTGNNTIDRNISQINDIINDNINSESNKIHARDLGREQLLIANILCDRTELLRNIVDISRSNFGFYTAHFPRVFEYTWILEKLEDFSGSILDIGAGVCPLPLCFAKNGCEVFTVDAHPVVRKDEDKSDWNEWGYLDYSRYHANITSANINFIDFKTPKKLDAIYSVSVIEHMPAKDRRKIFRKASKILKKGGELLITIDVVPNTDQIWNLSENKQVEDPTKHGEIKDLKKELTKHGFEITEEHMQRQIFRSRTDIYYIKATLKKRYNFFKI